MDLSGFNEEQQNFGKSVKQHRKDRNLRLLDLEVLTGIDDSTLSKIEKGKFNVELLTIYKLAQAFGVDTRTLLDYSKLSSDSKKKKKP
jgi:transcriptional regulator with XRE-family HTH domain